MRPGAQHLLVELEEMLLIWRSHEPEVTLWLARAEGALAAYVAIGVMRPADSDEWLDRYRRIANRET